MVFKYIQREILRIKSYPTNIINFMMNEDNWVELDPDHVLGGYALLSYPDHIFILNLDKASDDVEDFFNQFPNTKRHNDIIKEAALDPNLLDNESETFLEDDLNTNCVFAYIYPDSGESDIFNKNKFEDGNHVFIYNGLSEPEDYEQDDFSKKALNITDFELF